MAKYYMVDRAMNVVREGNDFDKLQSIADAEFSEYYVIDESDLLIAMSEEPLGLELPDSLR